MLEYANKLVNYCEDNDCSRCRFKLNGECVFKYCNLSHSIINLDTPSNPFSVATDELFAIVSLIGLVSECEKTPCHNCPLEINGCCIMSRRCEPEELREDLDVAIKLWYKERNEKIAESLEILYDACKERETCRECPLCVEGDCFRHKPMKFWDALADDIMEGTK